MCNTAIIILMWDRLPKMSKLLAKRGCPRFTEAGRLDWRCYPTEDMPLVTIFRVVSFSSYLPQKPKLPKWGTKSVLGKSDPLNGKISVLNDSFGQWFTYFCQVSWKSVKQKWPSWCVVFTGTVFWHILSLSLVPCLLRTSATVTVHFSLSLAILIRSTSDMPVHLAMFFKNVVRCLPLSLLPSIFPVRKSSSKPSFLIMWPKNSNCLFLMIDSSLFSVFAFFRTSELDVWLCTYCKHHNT